MVITSSCRRACGAAPTGVALRAGRRLSAADVALAAALGLTALDVRRRVRVALFSTGDEIAEPGLPLAGAALYDSNRYLLHELIRRFGGAVTDLGILRDEPKALARAITAAADSHDLVLTSGGVSTGEADYVRGVIESIGRIVFWRVAIKPGRPVAMGVIAGSKSGEGAAFVGLPGNPVAVFVTFVRVVRPLLLRLAGALPEPLVALPARAAFSYKKRKGRREYVRVTLRRAADGAAEAVKYPQDGAGVLTSLTETDGLAELGEEVTNIEPGAMVAFFSYASLLG
jgi:molybdopterin molybdotransferase